MTVLDRIGEYDIVGELGRGGFGVVYRARKRSLPGRDVALKEVPLGDTDKERERRTREARALLTIQSAHIVILHDVFEASERGTLCLVMELLNPENFRRRLHRVGGSIGLEATLAVLEGVLDALVAAHGATDSFGRLQPIVHRDLKPENIGFLSWRGGELVKVMDFGIARFTDPDARIGQPATTHAYTPAYAAPEVLAGQAAVPACDLWAVGLIAWEALVGRHALADEQGEIENPLQRLIVNQGTIPELPAAVRANTPGFLVDLIRRLSAHDPASRPSAAEAHRVVASLRRAAPAASVIEERPIGPVAASTGPARPAPPRRSTRTAMAVVASAAVAIVGAVTLWGLLHRPAPVLVAAPLAPPSASSPESGGQCPELGHPDPALASLTIAELENRVRAFAPMPPSTADKHIAMIRSQTMMYPQQRRDCMYRYVLVQQLDGWRQMGMTWDSGRSSADVAALFRALPLREPWTLEQRDDVLDQVEQHMVVSAPVSSDSDRDFYRRMYYSIVLRCHVTEPVLIQELQAQRPESCINFRPRR